MQDPDELQGLAHFTEHMLFYASKKYPKEDEYSKFVSDHGGHTNAWTSAENTNFQFTVNWDALESTLDRFAQVCCCLQPSDTPILKTQRPLFVFCINSLHSSTRHESQYTSQPVLQFFISPLISPDGITRERQAVDSEHSKNLQSDVWRRQQLWHTAADPAHPYSRFFTGNMDTLGTTPESKGIDVHAKLLEFYSSEYSANRMKLCVLGRHSVDELETMARRMFSDVPNKGVPGGRSRPHPQPALLPSCQRHPVRRCSSGLRGRPPAGSPTGTLRSAVSSAPCCKQHPTRVCCGRPAPGATCTPHLLPKLRQLAQHGTMIAMAMPAVAPACCHLCGTRWSRQC